MLFWGTFLKQRLHLINQCNFTKLFFFNAFHTIVLKINLLETVKHNKYIGHRLQGVLYKIQEDNSWQKHVVLLNFIEDTL